MIFFFQPSPEKIYALETVHRLTDQTIAKLKWLFRGSLVNRLKVSGDAVGPRKEMITGWSTDAGDISPNMGIEGICRIEEFYLKTKGLSIGPMLQAVYHGLDQDIFHIDIQAESVQQLQDIEAYSEAEGLALGKEEIEYLESVSKELGRLLTDSEVFGFSQVNSEHCRHKIFNGT